MIKSFRDRHTSLLVQTRQSRVFGNIKDQALRKLLLLESAAQLADLVEPPGNHLEALKGDRAGQHSIRINDQFRICFVWREDNAWDVEIVDYH